MKWQFLWNAIEADKENEKKNLASAQENNKKIVFFVCLVLFRSTMISGFIDVIAMKRIFISLGDVYERKTFRKILRGKLANNVSISAEGKSFLFECLSLSWKFALSRVHAKEFALWSRKTLLPQSLTLPYSQFSFRIEIMEIIILLCCCCCCCFL